MPSYPISTPVAPQRRPGRPVGLLVAALTAAFLGLGALIPAEARAAEAGDDAPGKAHPKASPAALDAMRPLAAQIGDSEPLEVHETPKGMAAFTFFDADDQPVTVADFRGQIVLLNFWATFCAPCLHEMPALDRLQAQLGGDAFQVVTVNLDLAGKQRPLAWLETNNIDGLAFFSDRKWAGPRALGAPAMPTTLLIDRSGREVARLKGAAEWDAEVAVQAIEMLINDAGS